MKIIDEKGKLFGVINIIDLILIIAVVAVIVGLGWKGAGSKIVQSKEIEVIFTTRTRAAHPRQFEEMLQTKLPAPLISGNTVLGNAELIEISSVPYEVQIQTQDGRMGNAIDPVRIDIIYKLRVRTPDSDIIKVGSQEIRSGRDHIIKTKFIEQNSIIEKIEIVK